MKSPQIELIPLREAISRGDTTLLDVLIRVIPPEAELTADRPPLNVGLVIDRSGSMKGEKLDYARKAAVYAVEQLLPSDRVGVVTYDDRVETLLPSTPAVNKHHIIQKIKRLHAGNATALHAGWVQGGIVVSEALQPEFLNRVLLLSDGLANVGETNADAICTDVRGLAERGVSTTAMGVGRDYNEDLLEAMARSGDGNYWFIQSPSQIPTIFDQELQGLMLTMGEGVTLDIGTGASVTLIEVLNDLDIDEEGNFRLSNLVCGNPLHVVARLKVVADAGKVTIFDLTLAWDDAEQQRRRDLQTELRLPAVSQSEMARYPVNEAVQEQVVVLQAAQAKQDAIDLVDQGQITAARRLLQKTQAELLDFSDSALIAAEAEALVDLDTRLKERDVALYRKMAQYQRHSRAHGHGYADLAYRLCRGPIKGDITKPLTTLGHPVEAIVNSADREISSQGALSGAIHRAAGPRLLHACQQLGGCGYGEAKITRGYELPVDWVIHTVCPPWQDGQGQEEELLRQCYLSCLQVAADQGIRTVAFPAIGVGAMGFPFKRAAEIAVQTVGSYLAHDRAVEAVLFVCYDDHTKRFFDTAFTELTGQLP